MILSRKIQWVVLSGLLLTVYGSEIMKWGADLWNDDNYSHGLLIPFVSWYFIRERLDRLRSAVKEPCFSGIFFLLAGISLLLLGYVGAEFFTKRLSLIIILYGLVLFIEGKEIAKILRFPIGILFFAIPLPYVLYNSVAFPLKLIATQIAVWMIDLYGVPVFQEGNIVHLPYTTMEVVDACSGIRSLMTLITLAFFLAYMMHKSLVKQIVILLLALPVVVLANSARVALNGILAKSFPMLLEGFWHDFFGWLVFCVSFAVLAGLSWLLKKQPGISIKKHTNTTN